VSHYQRIEGHCAPAKLGGWVSVYRPFVAFRLFVSTGAHSRNGAWVRIPSPGNDGTTPDLLLAALGKNYVSLIGHAAVFR